MKTETAKTLLLLALLALAGLDCQLSPALAQGQCVGVLTATYNVQVSGSGTNYDGDAEAGLCGSDQLSLALSGQAQFLLFQTATNLTTAGSGSPASSTAQQTVSGSQHHVDWFNLTSPPVNLTWYVPYVSDPNFDPTSPFMLVTPTTNGGGQFVAACARVSYGYTNESGAFFPPETQFGDDSAAWPWPPVLEAGTGYDAEKCVNRAMDLAQGIYFSITNWTAPWTLTLSTNLTVN